MDALTGSIESLSLSRPGNGLGFPEGRTGASSQTRGPGSTSNSRPQLVISIPTNILDWRKSIDHDTAFDSGFRRRRDCEWKHTVPYFQTFNPEKGHLRLLDELLESTPYKSKAEQIDMASGYPVWIGRIISALLVMIMHHLLTVF